MFQKLPVVRCQVESGQTTPQNVANSTVLDWKFSGADGSKALTSTIAERLVQRLLSMPAMKRQLLVVDDERQVRELLCFFLAKHGYEVFSAGSSEETVQLLDTRRIDLVVLDIGLAEEDGLGLLGRVKTGYPNTKVVMLTGMGFVEDLLEEAQQKGADGYVSKVLPLDELLLAVKRAIGTGQEELAGKQ